MSKKAVLLPMFAVVGLALVVPTLASADEYHRFISVSCFPEIGFFSLQTHGIYNPPPDYQDANPNILTAERLERIPYSCQLPNVRITLKGWCRQRVNPEEVPCVRNLGAGVGREQIAVFIHDDILPIPDPPVSSDERRYWLELTDRTHLVEIARDNEVPRVNVLHCRTPESYPLRYGGAPANLGKKDTECQAFRHPVTYR